MTDRPTARELERRVQKLRRACEDALRGPYVPGAAALEVQDILAFLDGKNVWLGPVIPRGRHLCGFSVRPRRTAKRKKGSRGGL